MVADVAEAEAKTTGQNREGMFFAARTFAMKFGQSLALVLFTSIALIGGVVKPEDPNTVYPAKIGMLIAALVAVAFCVAGALILFLYNEKKVMKTIAKEEDKAFMEAVEKNNK